MTRLKKEKKLVLVKLLSAVRLLITVQNNKCKMKLPEV